MVENQTQIEGEQVPGDERALDSLVESVAIPPAKLPVTIAPTPPHGEADPMVLHTSSLIVSAGGSGTVMLVPTDKYRTMLRIRMSASAPLSNLVVLAGDFGRAQSYMGAYVLSRDEVLEIPDYTGPVYVTTRVEVVDILFTMLAVSR